MKHVYAVLVLALVLVFALGSVASAGVLRGEDYDRPTGDPLDDGLDEDHPWGGDRVNGEGSIGDRTDDGQVVSITTTDYLYIDLWLSQLYRMFTSNESVLTSTPKYKVRQVPSRFFRTPRRATVLTTRSQISDGKAVAR